MTFWDHLDELRTVLLRSILFVGGGFLLALCFSRQLIALFVISLPQIETASSLIILGPLDGVMVTIKIAVWTSLVATAPIWGFFVLRFLQPALTKRETKLIMPFVLLSAIFVSVGIAWAFYCSLPLANRLLYGLNEQIGVNLWTLTNYISYAATFLLAHGAVAELFLLLLLLAHGGVVTPHQLRNKRRTVVVAILLLAAILTPPDVFTQVLLAGPLILLYEGAILYARIRARWRHRGTVT